MIWIELCILIACILIGARLGGIALGTVSGIGLVITGAVQRPRLDNPLPVPTVEIEMEFEEREVMFRCCSQA